MTTAVWIAVASVGQVQRQVQKSGDLAEASGAVVGATPTKLVHLCFWLGVSVSPVAPLQMLCASAVGASSGSRVRTAYLLTSARPV